MQTAVSDKLQFVAGWLTTPFRGIDKLKFVGLLLCKIARRWL